MIIIDFNKNEAVLSEKVHNEFDVNDLIARMMKMGYGTAIKDLLFRKKIFMNQDASLFILDARK